MAELLEQATYEIVSSDRELLILVDEDDHELGSLAKGTCHDGDGVLHRAFSLFVFNPRGELLLQQRSSDKRLWPSYWSNSCCSHPRAGESMDEATHRRLRQELGLGSTLRYLYKFQYHARFGDEGSERELCWVYAGVSTDEVRPNLSEVAQWRWVTPAALDHELATRPDAFTPWFKLEWPRVRSLLAEILADEKGS